uniref:Zinc finger protein n=1 Tax=Angiostrongylus cantonensis TaxID=6313 RepID=A0A0K0DII5_ANGCA
LILVNKPVMDLPHEVVYHHHLPVDAEEEMRMMEDQVEEHMDDIEYGCLLLVECKSYLLQADVSIDGGLTEPRAVHQCNICNKIFVSFKGLQQHAVIHTDQKPYQCDICSKSFRFKSNLFEHRSVHTGFTPHSCPYCGKTCRLKGNLKKHLKTHVTSKDELERAWRPFACNRRPAADIPDDAIIVRGSGDPFFTPPTRPRKKKLGLGPDPTVWIDKIRRGEILPGTNIQTKMMRLETVLKNNEFSLEEIFEQARTIAFEKFDCPMCRSQFFSRAECYDHLEIEHPMARIERPLFCEICLKVFADRKSLEQHESYHKRVHLMLDNNEIEVNIILLFVFY